MRSILLECFPYDTTTSAISQVNFASGRTSSSIVGATLPYHVRLRDSFTFSQLTFPDNLPSDTQVSIGEAVINNTDGLFDYLLDDLWGGRSLIVKVGSSDGDYASHDTIFTGNSVELRATKNDLTLALRDNSYKLQNPLQPLKFLGSGGIEGPLELKQVEEPLLLGRAKNLSPVMIDEVLQIFQFNSGASSAVNGVYDRGVPLTFSTNYASFALLSSAVVPSGSYATCLATSMVKLGAPAEALTLDAVGSYSSATTMSALIQAVLLDRGFTSGDFHAASWSEFATDFPYVLSGLYYQTPELEMAEWLQNVLSSAFAFYFFDSEGKLRARQFKFRTPVATVRPETVRALVRETSPKPIHRVYIDHDRNLTIRQISEYTLGYQDVIAYLKDTKVFIDTEADGSGGDYSYVGAAVAVMDGAEVSDTGVVEFRKITNSPWLSLSPDGTFTISDPGVDTASCTIRVTARQYYRDVVFTLVKSKQTLPKNMVISGTKRIFTFDTVGQADPTVQTSIISVALTNVAGPLTFTAVDNLGRPVTLS